MKQLNAEIRAESALKKVARRLTSGYLLFAAHAASVKYVNALRSFAAMIYEVGQMLKTVSKFCRKSSVYNKAAFVRKPLLRQSRSFCAVLYKAAADLNARKISCILFERPLLGTAIVL